MKKLFTKLRRSKRGFSLVELIVVIAIMAVIAAVLVPSLLRNVEESRANKDIKTMDELVNAVQLALTDQEIYDEMIEHSILDNVSCYVDKIQESGCYEKVITKTLDSDPIDQYLYTDDARKLDEVPYYAAGNMRGITITFAPEKSSNTSSYILKDGVVNKFVGRNTGYIEENPKLYNAVRSIVGDKVEGVSQTYRNSDFTIFIRMGTTGGNDANAQDAVIVYGQYNGTNLPNDFNQVHLIASDRIVGDAGKNDYLVNDNNNIVVDGTTDYSENNLAIGGVSVQKAPEVLDGKAFAIYSVDDNSLTFTRLESALEVGEKYDGKTITAIYDGFETNLYANSAQVPWSSYANQIKCVKMNDWIKPMSTKYWFHSFRNCSDFNLSKLDTSEVTSMMRMFVCAGYDVEKFILNIAKLDTSKVTDMSFMFYDAAFNSKEVNLNVSGLDTSKVTNMTYMFNRLGRSANTLYVNGLANWNTANVKNMEMMFYEVGYVATQAYIGDLSNWNVSSVTNMCRMFDSFGRAAKTLSIGDLSKWNVSNVTNMEFLFRSVGYEASSFNIGNLSNWDTSKVTNMQYLFAYSGKNSKVWYVGDLSKWDVSNVTTMNYMFYGAGENTSNWTIGNISKWNTSKVTTMKGMFQGAGYNATTWSVGELSKWDVSNVTDMTCMFYLAGRFSTSFKVGDLSEWNTGNVTDMLQMFSNAGSKATYYMDLSGWNVNKVTNYTEFNEAVGTKIKAPIWVKVNDPT